MALGRGSGTFVREVEVEKDGRHVDLAIHQMKVGDVGCVVWDAALVLSYYLQASGAKYVANKNVIELGAGTGVVGLVAAACGAKQVVLTDLPELLPLLRLNMEVNSQIISDNVEGKLTLRAASYRWGKSKDLVAIIGKENTKSDEPLHDFGCVLVADCVYYEDAVEPLSSTISHLLSTSGVNAYALCAYEDRDIGDKTVLQERFGDLLTQKYGLKIEYVASEEMHPIYHSDDIHIMFISSQPTS